MKLVVRILHVAFYVCLQVVFIPPAIVGLAFALYREFTVSKRLGVSFSAVKALQYRWMMHYFNTRQDSFSARFTRYFPCESHVGMLLILGPLIISVRLFGFPKKLGTGVKRGEETLDTLAGVRVLTFDEIMRKHVDYVEQVVLLGSGFDLIAHHFTKGNSLAVYEVDQVNALNVKVATLHRAGIACDWINYIPVDFSHESWDSKLLDAGFDTAKPALFIWQSVSLYLDPDAVTETLRRMSDLCTQGSVVAQDFYAQYFVDGDFSAAARRFKSVIEKMGEEWKFGIDMSAKPRSAVESFLRSTGLRMTGYIQFGEKLEAEPFYCIVESEKIPPE